MSVDVTPTGQVQEFVAVLQRRRWQIILPALFVLTFGAAFAVVVPKKYVVETRIELTETRNPLDYIGKNPQDGSTLREATNVQEHVVNYERIKTIVSTELIEYWPEYERADRATQYEILRKVMENVSVTPVVKSKSIGSTFVDIDYKDIDGDRAVAFLERVNTYWFEEIRAQSEADLATERDVLAEAEHDARVEYKNANDDWGKLCRQMGHNPAIAPDSRDRGSGAAVDFIYEALKEYQRKQQDNEVSLLNARSELKSHQDALAVEPDTVRQVQLQEGANFTEQIAAAEQAIEGIEAELARMTPRAKAYERNTKRIELIQKRIAGLREREKEATQVDVIVPNENKELLRGQVREKAAAVAMFENERELLKSKIDEFQEKADGRSNDYLLLQALWSERTEAVENLAAATRELRMKESAILLNKETAASGLRVTMAPTKPDAPSEPSVVLLVAFSLFAGLALGMAIALVSEYARNSYRTVTDLAAVLTVPVLGAITVIVTEREARRALLRRAVVGVSSVVILASVASMVYVWSDEDMQGMLPVSVLQAIESFRLKLM